MNFRYFDNAATTRVYDEVINEMIPYFSEKYANPSSICEMGKEAKLGIEEARVKVAKLINCEPNEIYFTSGGSESDNMAIKGVAYLARRGHIITTKIEHSAVIHTCQTLERKGFRVTYLDVDKDGMVNLDQLRRAIRNDTILISIMFANNEIGTIEPIYEISKIAKMYNIIFHTDAVQACGNVPIDVKKMGIDMLSLSGHKLHSPKGIGALYIRNGIKLEKYIDGGHQESDRRAGTENVPGIVGLGKACEIARNNLGINMKILKELRDYYVMQVENSIQNVRLNGSRNMRLPGNANFSFRGIDGRALVLELNKRGICVSGGSACAAGSTKPSHVLTALGLPDEMAKAAIRTTFGPDNTKEDIDYLVQNLKEILYN
ncbi:MAG: cysteine desulfurase NifS [Clostridiales bacterium]|nr:cysteine desulfurase NifS [Clostridiales bacterium]